MLLKRFIFWLKTKDTIYTFFCIKKCLRWIVFNPLWETQGLGEIKKFLTSWNIVNYHIISRNPLIIMDIWQHRSSRNLSDYIPKDSIVHFICLNWWHLENDADVENIQKEYAAHREQYPRHEIIYLCNTSNQYDLFARCQLPCLLCHQNAFLDENMHKIISECPKKYNAIYVAVGVPCKRHYLAKEIPHLASPEDLQRRPGA